MKHCAVCSKEGIFQFCFKKGRSSEYFEKAHCGEPCLYEKEGEGGGGGAAIPPLEKIPVVIFGRACCPRTSVPLAQTSSSRPYVVSTAPEATWGELTANLLDRLYSSSPDYSLLRGTAGRLAGIVLLDETFWCAFGRPFLCLACESMRLLFC